MLKCFGLVALLLFGILFGIQKANYEMHELKGPSNKESVESLGSNVFEKGEKNQMATSHDIKSKQETLRKVDSFNVFSALGQKLTSLISSAFSMVISIFGIVIQEMLAVFSP
jgi:hypothetical protein